MSIPTLCLMLTLGTWLWARQSLSALRMRNEETEEVIRLTDRLAVELFSAEIAVRGYTLTKDQTFLPIYERAIGRIPPVEASLQQLQASFQMSAAQQVEELYRLADQHIRLLERMIQSLNNEGSSVIRSPQTLAIIYQSRADLLAFRAKVDEFNATQDQALKDINLRRNKLQELTGSMLSIVTVVSLLSSAAAIFLFSQLDRDLQSRERMLNDSRNLLEAIVGSVVDGVIVLDEFGKVEMLNKPAAQLFDYAPEKVVGHDLGMLLNNDQATDARSEAADPPGLSSNYLSSHQIQLGRPWQTMGVRSDGSTLPIEISISEMLIDGRMIAIVRDITPFLETEAKLQSRADELTRLSRILSQTNTTLEDRNRELEQFAYVASHDLKAPLRAIANLSEWIEEDLSDRLPQENKNQMVLLRGRVHRMEALINGLLEYSRIGRTNTKAELVSVAALLADIVDSLAPPPTFTIRVGPDMPTFMTKRLPLRQVFANLIGNAVKHHHSDRGEVVISVEDQGEFYQFSVADNGPGIDPEYHHKIFTIFQTLHPRDARENTGIGLSIVKKIVETEGGSIQIQSAEGKGAKFTFTWRKKPIAIANRR
ncbi:sensor histidine kinase [Leptolyngbya sp. AN02str]|uniref:sensor histidine kinase n=1 Tax=Leptolyngbya sp. AN02str TaxID=3423363 RepID=UPI003D3221B9